MRRILLIDDNEPLLACERVGLIEEGYDVTDVPRLDLGLLEAKNGSFDCVIVDKNIGGHRGVVPFLDFMQEERPTTPVILFSAEDGKQARKELYCHEFVSKQSLSKELYLAIERVLSGN